MTTLERNLRFPPRDPDPPQVVSEPIKTLPGIPSIDDIEDTDAKRIERVALDINRKLPGLVKHEPTAMLLDINNLYKVADYNGFKIDYSRLSDMFGKRCDLRHKVAFSAVDRDDENSVGWADWMERHGYTMETKDLKRYITRQGDPVVKGNMDINLTIYAMNLSPSFAHIIIGTCDGDFIPLISELQKGGFRRVSLLAITSYDRSGLDQELKNTVLEKGGNFYDLAGLRDYVSYKGRRS